jgi:hypothetical protein
MERRTTVGARDEVDHRVRAPLVGALRESQLPEQIKGVDGTVFGDQLVKLQWRPNLAAIERSKTPLSACAAAAVKRLRCPPVDLKALNRGELIAIGGGILLAISLLLPWYSLGNGFAQLNSCHGPDSSCTGWSSLLVIRFILLATALAPLILAWIVARGHALAWPRGEVTAVVGVLALVLTVFRGVIDKPGAPTGEISIDFGWWLGLGGTLLMIFGAAWRYQESAPRRKPPGVL